MPLTSYAFSALSWLGVLVLYAGAGPLTWPVDVLVLLVGLSAIVSGLLAVILGRRSPLAWSSFALSLILPIWMWAELSSLPSDAF